MPQPEVTIIVSNRERFSFCAQSLDSIYADTTIPFHLVYVDAGSPPRVAEAIRERQRRYGFELIRSEHMLTPNEARNLGYARVNTPWVAFLDNDILVATGWLAVLMADARANDAALVGPVYLQDECGEMRVHMAGAVCHFYEEDGKRFFTQDHSHFGKRPGELEGVVSSGETELLEFYCMLGRTDVLDHHMPLDEELMTMNEQIDLCLQVREVGGRLWQSLDTFVTYVLPPPFEDCDLPGFLLRWNDDWNERTLRRFAEKWKIDPSDPYLEHQLRWARRHREIALRSLAWPLGRVAGRLEARGPANGKPGAALVEWLERRATRELRAQREAGLRRGARDTRLEK